MARDEVRAISAAAPTVTRPVGRCPVTRLVIRIRDRRSRTCLRSGGRIRFRDRRPRYLPVRSRVGVVGTVRRALARGNGGIVPVQRGRWSGALTHRTGTLVPGAQRHRRPRRLGLVRATSDDPDVGPSGPDLRPARLLRSRDLLRPNRCLYLGRVRPGRLPGPRGAHPDELSRGGPRTPRLRAELHQREPRDTGRRRVRGDPVRRRDMVVRRGARAGPGRVRGLRAGRRPDRRLLRGERPGQRADRDPRRIRSRPSPAARAIGSTPRPGSGCRRWSPGRPPTRTSSTWSSATTCPTRGSRRRSTPSAMGDVPGAEGLK